MYELKEMFFKLDLIQSYGSGIRRAKAALNRIGSPDLVFEPDNDTDDYTAVTTFINKEFAEYIHNSSNYYVIITRKPLKNLPYSIEEIYGIRTSGKYHFPEQVYHEFYPIYSEYSDMIDTSNVLILVEDKED